MGLGLFQLQQGRAAHYTEFSIGAAPSDMITTENRELAEFRHLKISFLCSLGDLCG